MESKKVTINVLASDFENNFYLNVERGLKGCPLQRAATRAGLEGRYFQYVEDKYEDRVQDMFKGKIPIEDFSFEIEIN